MRKRKYQIHNSYIINEWFKEIIRKVKYYRDNIRNNLFNNTEYSLKKFKSWDYLGNGIINKLIKNVSVNKFFLLDRNKMQAFPELRLFQNSSQNIKEKYKALYFEKRDPQIILDSSKSIILLHNSWTPFKYKAMSEEEFLNQDVLLSKLLSHLLNKKL